MRKKAVPVGIEDFERIINEDYYYVDKTMLIEKLLINRTPVTLFTRPRRFGKTLNMSMLKYFFDVKDKEENKKLFENLKIYDSEYMSEQGKYPVIFISLKDLKEDTWEECLESIKDTMYKIFNEYSFLREKLNVVEKRQFDKIWEITGNERNFKTSLLDLSNYLNKYYGEKVIILIDEYDAPIINAFDKGYYNEAINFFQTFYSSALKTNNSLKYGILTGITRIIKEGIFSGLNNLKVDTILNKKYFEYFGLLESEVIEMLDYFGMKYKIEEVKEWYNGYGRYDLAMIPIKSNEKAYLMEFKISKTKKGMEEKAQKALKQIDEKKYDTKLKARGIKNILKIGIAFYGKEVKVVF